LTTTSGEIQQELTEQSSTEQNLLGLMNAVSAPAEPERFTPPIPETLEDAGLTNSDVEQLLLKHLYYRGELLGRDLSDALGLKFSLIEGILETLKRQHLAQVKGSLGFGPFSSVFSLSESGRSRARRRFPSPNTRRPFDRSALRMAG
jgi:hypothetical protein